MEVLVRFVIVSFLCASLSACWAHSETKNKSVTLGQELIDLKKALDEGAITQDQYDDAREDLVDAAGE